MSKALAIPTGFQPMTAAQVRAQVNLVQEVMRAVMQKGQHYGTIPGCGEKPTLLKPGAEKLMMTFRLAADPQVEEVPTEDGLTYRVTCSITNQATGVFLGSGLGECSSKEEKYNWRGVVSGKEWMAVAEDKKRIKYTRNGEIRQVRTNPADFANTVLKMAKKRALVDAILTVTAASDIFTQDIEDMPEEVLGTRAASPMGNSSTQSTKASTVQPASASQHEDRSAPETKKDVRQALKDELGAYCGGDVAKMKRVLKDVSKFTTAEGKELSISDIDKAKEGWVGKALSTLRDLTKKGSAPEMACQLNPETCADSNFSPDAQGNLIASCTHPEGNGACAPGKGKTY